MKAQNFKQFTNESEDQTRIEGRLRDLGLAPKEEFDDRFVDMVDEWGSDPEINQALDALKARTKLIVNKHIDFSDPEDETEFEQRVEWINEQGADDIGYLEFMMLQREY